MFEVLFLIGLVALIGLASRWLFEKTKVPEVILLMFLGFLLGPLGLITQFGMPKVDPSYFQDATPVVGAVVIIFLVFDAAFRLKAKEILVNVSFSTVFALANIVACMAILAAVLHFGLGWEPISSLLLAAILCGPSTYAIYSILPLVRASNYTRTVLYLEGTLSTIIVCVIAITLMRFGTLQGNHGVEELLRLVASSFSISFILGLALGLLLLWTLMNFKTRRFGYLLTLAALLVLYFVDFALLGGIGVISIAVIGFVLGNATPILKLFGKETPYELDESFGALQNEMGLFVSTFFFVYLGMIFRPEELSLANVALALLLLGGILFSRLIVILAARAMGHTQHKENVLLAVMVPSDLLSATLATFIFLYPGIATFKIELVLLAIAATTIFTSLGVGYYERLLRGTYLFRREIRLSSGRVVAIRSFTKDDIGKVGKFLNEMVKEGALIALDQQINPSEEKEMGTTSIVKINRGEMILWVGEWQGRIIARAVAEKMPGRERDNVSLSFYVAKDFRGAGLGSALLRMLVDEATRVFSPHNLYLTVYSDNERAMKLYRREGFAKVGVLPGWMKHEDRYLDRVFMLYRKKSRQRR
jgi:potassium/hydrogen antiporter